MPHRQRGHGESQQLLCAAAESFIVHKEKRLVLPVVELGQFDRPAKGAAKLVVPEGRKGSALPVKEIARVHGGVAQKFKRAPVPLVGSRFGHDIHNRARVPSLVGAEEIGLNFELLDGIHPRPQHNRERQPVIIVDSIEQEVVRSLPIAIREDLRAGSPVVRTRPAHDRAGHTETCPVHARR